MDDYKDWRLGIYFMSAVNTALQGALAGKNSKAKYIEKPLSQSDEQNTNTAEAELSEEEKKRQRDKLLMSLQIMQANFEMNHGKEGS